MAVAVSTARGGGEGSRIDRQRAQILRQSKARAGYR